MSVLDEILHTCSKMEIPANPNRKAIIIIEIPSLGVWIKLIKFIPEVSSIKPDKIGIINLVSTFTRLKIGKNKLANIPNIISLLSNDIITLNNTTNPPIKKIDLIAFSMLLEIISPKLLNVIVLSEIA